MINHSYVPATIVFPAPAGTGGSGEESHVMTLARSIRHVHSCISARNVINTRHRLGEECTLIRLSLKPNVHYEGKSNIRLPIYLLRSIGIELIFTTRLLRSSVKFEPGSTYP